MKVESKRGSGLKAVMTAITGVAVAVTLVVGAGIVPAYMASAQVAEVGSGNNPGGGILQPAAEQPKAEELREPSGLGAVEAKASGVRKPTVVKPKPAPKPAPPKQQTPATSTASTAGWKSAKVSWYGPGFYGNTMAGGGKLTPSSMVVAHRTLPFGTKIEFSYKGRTCVAVVQDRGPHVAGRIFDLGPGTAGALGFSGVGTVQYRIVSN